MDSKRSFEWIVHMIKENYKGRKIVFRGKNAALEERLKSEGFAVAFYVSSRKDAVNNIDTFHISILGQKSSKYYVVVPMLKYCERERDLFKKYEYNEIEDVLWIMHKPINVMEYYENYVGGEKYANLIEQYMSENINIELHGVGNTIDIGKNVQWNKNNKIILGNDCFLKIGSNVKMGDSSIVICNGAKLVIEDNCKLHNNAISLNIDSEVRIGEGTTFGQNARIRPGRNRRIVIGNDCMFSWDTVVLGHDGHLIYDIFKQHYINNTNGAIQTSIVIGNHVWIGGEVALLPGTHIGDGCIVGYRSLVKSNFQNNCVIAGSPAKMVKRDVTWRREQILTDDDISNLEVKYGNRTILEDSKNK